MNINNNSGDKAIRSIELDEFARIFAFRGPSLMWLVGAGASVAAGVPSARQMVDDFKAIIYATIHKVPLDSINLGEPGTRSRVQVFFDTHPGLPSASDPDEYSRAFEAACPSAKDRRNYIESQISKGRPAFGNMGLAVLAALERIRIVWTTNFDRVIEDSANAIMTLPARLTVAALETSDIAVQAIAQGRFPLLVKLHGDYQSEHLKNTSAELQRQDESYRSALIQSCSTRGLIVAGYSGRDRSLMNALIQALDTNTPFPDGIFWARRDAEDCYEARALLSCALAHGVEARWIDVQTFDELIASLVVTVNVPVSMQKQLEAHRVPRRRQSFVLPTQTGDWPVLRLNALEVKSYPTTCRVVACNIGGTKDVRVALAGVRSIGARRRDGVICFGVDDDIRSALKSHTITGWTIGSITTDILSRESSSEFGLLYDSLTGALARVRPLIAVRSDRSHCLVVDPDHENDTLFDPLRAILRRLANQRSNMPGGDALMGTIAGTNLRWCEGVRLRLERQFETMWLVFEPFVWAEYDNTSFSERRVSFVARRRWHRYNRVAYSIFKAWEDILATGSPPTLFGITEEAGVDARFELSGASVYARGGGGLR